MGVIAIVIVIAFGYKSFEVYFPILIKSSLAMLQLGFAVLLCIIMCVWIRKKVVETKRLLNGFTESQLKQLKHARDEDVRNDTWNRKNKKEVMLRYDEKVAVCQEKIRRLNAQAQVYVNNMAKLDILGRDEWNTEVVDFLIRALESHRANNISEALRLYDEDNRRRQDAMHRQAQQWLLEFDAKKRHEEQLEHNRRMEELERERLKETKKIKESLKETEKYIDRLKGY